MVRSVVGKVDIVYYNFYHILSHVLVYTLDTTPGKNDGVLGLILGRDRAPEVVLCPQF